MTRLTLLACVFTIVCASRLAANVVTIATVPVGYAGNANDPGTGNLYGGVSYDYRIGTYEVTIGQYTAFLNAVAATDTYGLYSPFMTTNLNIAGISRSGVDGSYSYGVIGSANKPITYVNWGDAARFTNWLHNGQPTGVQNASTTESGAYELNGAITTAALNAVVRNADARWFIPSENEWYKAAYYQPAADGGDSDNYWAYPTRTNAFPRSTYPAGAGSNAANYFLDDNDKFNGFNDGYAVTASTVPSPTQNYLTNVGAYSSSIGPFGTFDQAGNVGEWSEKVLNNSDRHSLGGNWFAGRPPLRAGNVDLGTPVTSETPLLGFRVAAVPEPSAMALGAIALASLAVHVVRHRRRRVK